MSPPTPRPPRNLNTDPLVLSLVRWLLIIVFVVMGWWIVSKLAAILAPILAALGIAYLLDPVLEKLVARGMSRAMAATVLLVAFLGTVGGALVLLIPVAIDQIRAFAADLPSMIDRLATWVEGRFEVDVKSHLNAEELQAVMGDAAGPLEHLAKVALGGAFSVLALLAEFLLVPVFAYYFLLDWPHISGRVIRMVPPRRRERVKDLLAEIDGVVAGWVRGQAIVTIILSILYALVFWIIGVPLAIPIGLLVGALTIIPFVGTIVGAAITAVVLLLDWQGGGMMGAVGATFIVLHLLEAAVLTPKIVGHKVGLSESAALFAVVAGGKLLGFVGILLAVPLAATVAVLLRHAVRYYEKSEFFGDEADAVVPVTPAMEVVMMAHPTPADASAATSDVDASGNDPAR